MMTGTVSVIMRLANFGVFIGLILYVYRRYGKEYIHNLIDQDARIDAGLEKELESVATIYAHCKRVTDQTIQQRLRLQNNIVQWQQAVCQDNAQRIVEKRERIALLKQKEARRTQVLYDLSVKVIVVPESIKLAREHLVHAFSNEKQGADFVHSIITRMQESKS